VTIWFRTARELPGLGSQTDGCGAPHGAGMAFLLLAALAAGRREG